MALSEYKDNFIYIPNDKFLKVYSEDKTMTQKSPFKLTIKAYYSNNNLETIHESLYLESMIFFEDNCNYEQISSQKNIQQEGDYAVGETVVFNLVYDKRFDGICDVVIVPNVIVSNIGNCSQTKEALEAGINYQDLIAKKQFQIFFEQLDTCQFEIQFQFTNILTQQASNVYYSVNYQFCTIESFAQASFTGSILYDMALNYNKTLEKSIEIFNIQTFIPIIQVCEKRLKNVLVFPKDTNEQFNNLFSLSDDTFHISIQTSQHDYLVGEPQPFIINVQILIDNIVQNGYAQDISI
eukprot:403333465